MNTVRRRYFIKYLPPLYAACLGDALSHVSMMADILGGVLVVAGNVAIIAIIAIIALPTAAVVAATGTTAGISGTGACVMGAVVGVIVGFAMSKTRLIAGRCDFGPCPHVGERLADLGVHTSCL